MVERYEVHWFFVRLVCRHAVESEDGHPGPTGVHVRKFGFRSHGVHALGDAVCDFDQ